MIGSLVLTVQRLNARLGQLEAERTWVPTSA